MKIFFLFHLSLFSFTLLGQMTPIDSVAQLHASALVKENVIHQNREIVLLEDDKNPGALMGYPFKGKYFHKKEDDQTKAFSINPISQHDLYIDQTGTATINDILTQQDILPWNNVAQVEHQANAIYWTRTRFYGSPYFNGEQILNISKLNGQDIFGPQFIDSYISDGRGWYHQQRSGERVPVKERAYENWANLIKLDIGLTDTLDLFIRMNGANAKFLLPSIEEPQAFLWHIDPLSLLPSQSNYAFQGGLLFGLLGIQCIFFFLLSFIEKEKTHFYYSILILGYFIMCGSDIPNYFNFIVFPNLNQVYVFVFPIGLFLLNLGWLKFVESHFNYSKSSIYRKWVVPITLLINALIAINFSIQFHFFYNQATTLLSFYYNLLLAALIISAIIGGLAVYKAPKQENASKLYIALAFGPFALIGITVLFASMLSNEKALFYDVALAMDLSVIAMLIMLSLSIGYRTKRLKESKLIAEQKNIFDQKEKENAERIKLSAQQLEKTNDLLEIQNAKNEVLLKEIHHRVKNNLQTISSLLSLQSNSIADQGALDAVQESQNRVASMALIHQKLYQGENLAAIEMRDYFETIGTEILSSFGEKATDVELEVNMPEMELDVDTAIPIGLITNELLTNSLKYAFREKESGKISIAMTQDENNLIQLMIEDNGAYTTNSINQGGTGFGTLLIHLLTTQLNGQLEQITTNGTVTIISFPLKHAA